MRRMMIMHDHATNMQPLADQWQKNRLFWSSACAVKSSLNHFLQSMLPFVWNYHQHRAWIWKERKGIRWFDGTSYILYHFIQWYANDMPSEILPPPATQLHLQRTLRSCQVWGRLEMAMSSAALCSPPRGCPSFGNRGSTHIWEGFVGQILQNLGWN